MHTLFPQSKTLPYPLHLIDSCTLRIRLKSNKLKEISSHKMGCTSCVPMPPMAGAQPLLLLLYFQVKEPRLEQDCLSLNPESDFLTT